MRYLVLIACAAAAGAYSPPVDTAGPLTARIEGPSVILRTGAALPVSVVLESKADGRLDGTVRLRAIDGWRAEPPEGIGFRLEPKGTARLEFTVTAAERSYNAHYPLHAFAEFTWQGEMLVAHPVLIVETKLPDPARAQAPLEWSPAEPGADAGLAVWSTPVRRAVIQVFGQPPRTTATGWEGSDEETRAVCQFGARVTRGDAREVVAIHPPWYQGRAGTLLAEFPVRLPEARPIRLRFAVAVRDPDPGSRGGDGVTFRVRALPFDAAAGQQGEILWERHSNAKTWEEAETDLSRFAGQALRLQLESHPGPRNDTSFDQSYWAEPTLVAGQPPVPAPLPPPAGEPSVWLGRIGEREVRVWPGRRGLLDATVGLGGLYFQGFRVRVLGDQLEDWRAAFALLATRDESTRERYRIRHLFRGRAGTFDLVGELWTEREVLRARWTLENAPAAQPWQAVYLEDAAPGRWSARARRVYAGQGNVLEEPEAFRLSFDGHRLATSFAGFEFENGDALVAAVDVPPSYLEVEPASRLYALHAAHAQTMTFIPAANVWEGARRWHDANGLAAAGGVAQLAGRFVFDLWGGRYGASAASLERAFRYGLTDAAVVWHNWQRWGYDYRLPDIYPPNPQLGAAEEFQALAETCRLNGVLFAPHDNYIDYYPDAGGFSYSEIAFNAAGAPVKAWYNEGRDAQSYRWRADRLRPYVERNLPLLRDAFAPTAYFIDVWSSAGPYDYWTEDGRFLDRLGTRQVWGETFAWIRDFLGGDAPTISESGHDQLIGYLDGAQSNHLRVDAVTPSTTVWAARVKDAERVPWLDAAHHDRFVLHGAGYESRYAGGLDTRVHGIYSDDYMTTEALTGHPAMAPAPFGRDVVRKYWLLRGLGRALALKRIEAVEFDRGNPHRQHVRWEGGEVWVNRGAEDWAVAGRVLPEYGFYARVGEVEAAIERRDGVIVEWSRSPAMYYVNARPVVSDRLPLKVAVESARFLGGRRFEVAFRWEAAGAAPEGVRIFVHFTDAAGNILFQGDHNPPAEWTGTQRTSVQVAIPAQIADGQAVELRMGLYRPGEGTRYLPEGPDDGTRRLRMGTLTWTGADVLWSAYQAPPDPALARLNTAGRAIAFDGVTTVGALRVTREGEGWILTPLPDGPAFEVRLRGEARVVEELDEAGTVTGAAEARVENGETVFTRRPAVFAYRLY